MRPSSSWFCLVLHVTRLYSGHGTSGLEGQKEGTGFPLLEEVPATTGGVKKGLLDPLHTSSVSSHEMPRFFFGIAV